MSDLTTLNFDGIEGNIYFAHAFCLLHVAYIVCVYSKNVSCYDVHTKKGIGPKLLPLLVSSFSLSRSL